MKSGMNPRPMFHPHSIEKANVHTVFLQLYNKVFLIYCFSGLVEETDKIRFKSHLFWVEALQVGQREDWLKPFSQGFKLPGHPFHKSPVDHELCEIRIKKTVNHCKGHNNQFKWEKHLEVN